MLVVQRGRVSLAGANIGIAPFVGSPRLPVHIAVYELHLLGQQPRVLKSRLKRPRQTLSKCGLASPPTPRLLSSTDPEQRGKYWQAHASSCLFGAQEDKPSAFPRDEPVGPLSGDDTLLFFEPVKQLDVYI
jgi:hypothetical protein